MAQMGGIAAWAFVGCCLVAEVSVAGSVQGMVLYTGRVVDASGTPVSGARVGLYRVVYDGLGIDTVADAREATSGPDGAFTFQASARVLEGPETVGVIAAKRQGLGS